MVGEFIKVFSKIENGVGWMFVVGAIGAIRAIGTIGSFPTMVAETTKY